MHLILINFPTKVLCSNHAIFFFLSIWLYSYIVWIWSSAIHVLFILFLCQLLLFHYTGSSQMFNISWLAGGHPILHPATLMSEANRKFGILLDFIQSAGRLPGALTIASVSWYVSGCISLFLCIYIYLYSSWFWLCLVTSLQFLLSLIVSYFTPQFADLLIHRSDYCISTNTWT